MSFRALCCLLVSASVSCASASRQPSGGEDQGGAKSGPAASSAGGTASAPRRVRASKDGAVILRITEGPGVLTDSNAPPPPPGSKPAQHPFVGASCGGGKPALCSQARDLLMASGSFDDFLSRLKGAGFTLEE